MNNEPFSHPRAPSLGTQSAAERTSFGVDGVVIVIVVVVDVVIVVVVVGGGAKSR